MADRATAQAQDDDAEWLRGYSKNSLLSNSVQRRFRRIATRLSVTTPDTTVLVEAHRLWRELDPHYTSVIRGVPDDFYGDDPRINIFDEKVDAGEAPRLTVGLFLGQHKWAMQRFSPEQLIGVVGMILSKPSVKATLASTANPTGAE